VRGLVVVRGPGWDWGDQDGGDGYISPPNLPPPPPHLFCPGPSFITTMHTQAHRHRHAPHDTQYARTGIVSKPREHGLTGHDAQARWRGPAETLCAEPVRSTPAAALRRRRARCHCRRRRLAGSAGSGENMSCSSSVGDFGLRPDVQDWHIRADRGYHDCQRLGNGR